MHDVTQIRNTVILGHGKSGKTTLAEALLFTSGKIKRLGKVDEGNTCMDYEPEEIKRKASISAAINSFDWKKNTVFLADTPGDDNFLTETKFAVATADSAILTVGAVLGVRDQTEKFVDFVLEKKMPCLICITKMDRERADFTKTVQQIKDAFAFTPVVCSLPIGAEDDFRGVVDLIANSAFFFEGDSGKAKPGDIPAELADEVETLRESLMEYVAETDEDLLEEFLEEGELSSESLRRGLAAAVREGEITPVVPCAALGNRGTSGVLDAIVSLLPSPDQLPPVTGTNPKTGDPEERSAAPDAPFSGQVFKTITDPFAGRLTVFRVYSGTLAADHFYNASKDLSERFGKIFLMSGKEQKTVDQVIPGMIAAVAKLKETATGDTVCDENAPIVFEPPEPAEPMISYAVSAKKGDEEKLFASISKMLDEDLTLRLIHEPQTKEVLVSGVGQMHLEAVGDRIKRKFGVQMELRLPKVPYRETITGTARVQGKHKKQSGGRGQFGDCWIEMEPLPRGEGYEFIDRIVGGVIPQQYRPAVDKGIQEAMENGVLAGYPMVDVKITLVDGSFHAVDSSEMAFKIAGSLAFKKAAVEAKPVLLEPIMELEVRIPQEFVGDVMGDLNGRRGKVLGMDSTDKFEVINAQVPQAEILLYATDLTSITHGRGSFSCRFSHYEQVPAQLAEKIIEEASK